LKNGRKAQGVAEIFYPGEPEAHSDRTNRSEGLLLPEDTLSDLTAIAQEQRLSHMLPF
jgi:LDH2 family malate/lactate/ureidoglycolate dehydrogenase